MIFLFFYVFCKFFCDMVWMKNDLFFYYDNVIENVKVDGSWWKLIGVLFVVIRKIDINVLRFMDKMEYM